MDATQDRLLDAAGQLFAEKGFDGATVREICQRADVNIAAVNYYYRDKERLYIEAVKSACGRQAVQFPLPDWSPGTPAEVKLRGFIETLARRLLADQGAHWQRQLFFREMAQPTTACAELVRDHMRPTCEVLSAILRELLPGVPEVKQRLIGFSIVGQCVFHRVAQPIVAALVGPDEYRTYNAEFLADHIVQFTLAALGLEKPKSPRSKASKPSRA